MAAISPPDRRTDENCAISRMRPFQNSVWWSLIKIDRRRKESGLRIDFDSGSSTRNMLRFQRTWSTRHFVIDQSFFFPLNIFGGDFKRSQIMKSRKDDESSGATTKVHWTTDQTTYILLQSLLPFWRAESRRRKTPSKSPQANCKQLRKRILDRRNFFFLSRV